GTLGLSPRTWASMSTRKRRNCETHPGLPSPTGWLSCSAKMISTSMSNFMRVYVLLYDFTRNVPDHAFHEFRVIHHHEIKIGVVDPENDCSFHRFNAPHRDYWILLEHVTVNFAFLQKCGFAVHKVEPYRPVPYN